MSLVLRGTVEETISRIRALGFNDSEQLTVTIERPLPDDGLVYANGIRQFETKEPGAVVTDRMIKDMMADL
jgi:hypothetical protein